MGQEEQQDMQLNLTPKGEAELAAREAAEVAEAAAPISNEERQAAEARRLVAAEQAGRQLRTLLGSVGAKIETPAPPGNDLSDLFEGPDMEKDNDVYTKDLTKVDEEDVMGDGDPEMHDLLEVSDEDIMGEEEEPENPPAKKKMIIRQRLVRRPPGAGIAGLQY